MALRNELLVKGTESFARGEMESLILHDGAVELDSAAGKRLPMGSYSTPETAMPAFCNLSVSWNADLPKGTLLEVEARVLVGSNWSGWFSFGKWSTYYPRRSENNPAGPGDEVFLIGDNLTVTAPGGATGVQLRAQLYSDGEKQTPRLWLLAASVRPLHWEKETGLPVNRKVYLAGYSVTGRDPRFMGSRSLPLALAGIVNRYGLDILPEELAYAMCDHRTADCRNAAYAAAAVGSCGHPCWQVWADLARLRRELYQGFALAVEVERRDPATGKPGHVWMGLSGFDYDESVHADSVELVDPNRPSDSETACTMALEDFARIFTGRAILVRSRPHGVWGQLPDRQRCGLKAQGTAGEYLFTIRGEVSPLDDDFAGWIACAVQDKAAHPTTAHRSFQRLEKTPYGGIRLPANLLTPGIRFSVYAVDQTGAMRVAELRL